MGGVLLGKGSSKGERAKKNKKCMHSHGVPNKKERSSYQKKRAVARYNLVKKMVKRLKSSGGANTRGKR